MTGLYLLLLALMLSLRIQIDAEGILQRWLFSGVRVPWKADRPDGTHPDAVIALAGQDGKEQILLSFLAPLPRSRPSPTRSYSARASAPAPSRPGLGSILEQWERKKVKIAIIDYGMGNLRSVEKAFHKVGFGGRIRHR